MKATRTKGKSAELAELLPGLTKDAFRSHGFGNADIVLKWEAIAGSFAQFTRPLKIAFSRGERMGGTLHLEVEGAYATELHHVAPILIDRVNAYLGYGAVAQLKLVHVSGLAGRETKKAVEKMADPALLAAFEAELDPGLAPEMRAALCRLANAALAQK